jgi:hypothetical protein
MCPDLRHFTSSRANAPVEDIPRQLRELPAALPPPYDWAEFRRRGRNRFPARRSLVKWPHAAAAAGLAVFVAGMAMLGTGDSETKSIDVASMQVSSASTPFVLPPPANDPIVADTQGQQTREWLARQPAEPVLVDVGSRITIANLEDRIAWFDDTLTDGRLQGANADYVKVLQQERARLVSSLAQVRYAEALAADGS